MATGPGLSGSPSYFIAIGIFRHIFVASNHHPMSPEFPDLSMPDRSSLRKLEIRS